MHYPVMVTSLGFIQCFYCILLIDNYSIRSSGSDAINYSATDIAIDIMQLIQLKSGMAHTPISLCIVALRSKRRRYRDQSVVEQLLKQTLFNTGSAKTAGRLYFGRLWSMDMCCGTDKACDHNRSGETSLQRYRWSGAQSVIDTYR